MISRVKDGLDPKRDDGVGLRVSARVTRQVGCRSALAAWMGGVIVAVFVTMCLVEAGKTEPNGQWAAIGHWLSEFGKSGGFGGLCALVAATIAFASVGRQLEQTRSLEANKSWWERLEWATEHGLLVTEHGPSLPDSVIIPTLEALADSARSSGDPIQLAAVGSLVDEVSRRTPADSPVVEQLRSYQARTQGSAAFSPVASERIYAKDVQTALAGVFSRRSDLGGIAFLPEVRVSSVEHKNVRADGMITRGERVLAVLEFKAAKTVPSLDNIQQWLEQVSHVRSAAGATVGLIVSPWDLREQVALVRIPSGVRVVQWRSSSDDGKLEKVLDEIR